MRGLHVKIQRTPEIDNFFKNCMDNLKKENKNRFLSAKVTNKNESYLQKHPLQLSSLYSFVGIEEEYIH